MENFFVQDRLTRLQYSAGQSSSSANPLGQESGIGNDVLNQNLSPNQNDEQHGENDSQEDANSLDSVQGPKKPQGNSAPQQQQQQSSDSISVLQRLLKDPYSESWSVGDVNAMLEVLLDKKRKLERSGEEVELEVLLDFLRRMRQQKKEKVVVLKNELEMLDTDIAKVYIFWMTFICFSRDVDVLI